MQCIFQYTHTHTHSHTVREFSECSLVQQCIGSTCLLHQHYALSLFSATAVAVSCNDADGLGVGQGLSWVPLTLFSKRKTTINIQPYGNRSIEGFIVMLCRCTTMSRMCTLNLWRAALPQSAASFVPIRANSAPLTLSRDDLSNENIPLQTLCVPLSRTHMTATAPS